jgi:hypothetical protein
MAQNHLSASVLLEHLISLCFSAFKAVVVVSGNIFKVLETLRIDKAPTKHQFLLPTTLTIY